MMSFNYIYWLKLLQDHIRSRQQPIASAQNLEPEKREKLIYALYLILGRVWRRFGGNHDSETEVITGT
jgi:hypothetical protein